MLRMALRAIIFDFGNVVGFFDYRRTTDRLAPHAALPADAVHAQLFEGPLLEDYESGRLSSEEFLRHARDRCRLSCSDDVLRDAWADIFTPNPPVCAMLPRLKPRYRLLLGSNTNELHARHFSRQFADAFAHFDRLVFSWEVGARKPAPTFFEHCVRVAGCLPGECLFLDDLPANVDGARACGLHGIVYTPGMDLPARLTRAGVVLGPAT
jgi:FMN phosphatase YigB (HAD superfamily)